MMHFEYYVSDVIEYFLENKDDLEEIFEEIFEIEYKKLLQENGITENKEKELGSIFTLYQENKDKYKEEPDYTSDSEGLYNALDLSTLNKIDAAKTGEEKTDVLKEIIKVAFDMCYSDLYYMKSLVKE